MLPKTYTDFIKELPAPTSEQIKNFVELVAKDHSWYKHLPSDRTIPFIFYLDPNAARKLVTVEEDKLFSKKIKFKFEEIKDDNLIQEHINKFGYWRYNFSENNGLLEGLLQNNPNRYIGLNIVDSNRFSQPLTFSGLENILCPIPTELIKKFTFKMSHYLHPIFNESYDFFDDKFPEKSYAQMHKDIVIDLTEHLTSIVDT